MKHFILLLFACAGLINIKAQPFETTTIGTNIIDPLNITRIDLDKDGDEDIVSLGGDTNIEFFSNNGDGTYTHTTLYNGPTGIYHFKIADMDNDTEYDIIAGDLATEKFVFLKNDGSENFTENVISQSVDVLNNPYHFALANFDADNYKDIVVCAQHANNIFGVFFLKNNGNGTFAAPDEIIEDDFVNEVIAADFNGDDHIDIIVSKNGMLTAGGLYKGINNGSGSFTYTAITTAEKFDRLQLCDMDGDTDMDFMVRSNTRLLYWYENDGSSAFTAHQIVHPYTEGTDMIEFYPINFDGDSDMDFLFFSTISGDTNMDRFDLGYYENDGSHNFSSTLFLQNQPEMASAAPFDLDNDGDLDFYLSSEDNSDIILYKNLKIDTPTDILSTNETKVMLYPNPVSNQLFIECEHLINNISVCDMSGRLMKQETFNSKTISVDMGAFTSGIYHVIIKTNEQTLVKKVTKQ